METSRRKFLSNASLSALGVLAASTALGSLVPEESKAEAKPGNIEPRRLAVITGAARGIGRAISLTLAKNGIDIFGIDFLGEVSPRVEYKYSTEADILQTISTSGKNECGDYVCYANVLNCIRDANDSRNRTPVVGERYLSKPGKYITYKGCSILPKGPAAIAFYGLSYPKEFYGSDYSVFNPPEPEYQSTIYWKHAYFIDSKEIELEFYTSDITGPFSIIIQGVSSNGLIYEKKEFLVNKK